MNNYLINYFLNNNNYEVKNDADYNLRLLLTLDI